MTWANLVVIAYDVYQQMKLIFLEIINVYNLEIEDLHTYYMAAGVLVHNQYENAGSPKADGTDNDTIVEVTISREDYPESAKHIEDAIAAGKPEVLTIDRGGAKDNRKASLEGVDVMDGLDRDEYPPAMSKEGGKGASVRGINRSDNRGSGFSRT